MSEQHLDLDALADLLVGEGTADDVEHVAGCARCSATLADLDDALGAVDPVLTALLAAPVPELPAGFDDRLAARLAETPVDPPAEGSEGRPVALAVSGADEERDAPAPARGAPAGGEPVADVVPLRPRRARGAGLLGVAAGGVGLLVAGAVGLSLAGGGLRSGDGAESAAGGSAGIASGALPEPAARDLSAAGTASPLVLASGTDYPADGDAVAALLPALVGPERLAVSGDTAQQLAAEEATEQGAEEGAEQGAEEGTAADAPAPVAPATAETGAPPAGAGAAAAGSLGEDPLARLRDPAVLQACLQAVAASAAGSTPEVAALALDYATTSGRPALVVVQSAGAGLVEVTAVGPSCGAGGADRIWSHRLPG